MIEYFQNQIESKVDLLKFILKTDFVDSEGILQLMTMNYEYIELDKFDSFDFSELTYEISENPEVNFPIFRKVIMQ